MSGSGFWKTLETLSPDGSVPLRQALDEIPWNADGLIPAIAQQYDTKEVLMLAWMNREALQETLENGRVCYWSRSRQQLWRKGESSGQVQELREARFDCDGDTLLLLVDQTGPACHTGRRDCFYNLVQGDRLVVDKPVLIDPETLYK
ncbi:phosphoribosyl-AMP cyclohydrolase [Thiolapillus sp.]